MPSLAIKICGLTTREQTLHCLELGANWLGFNCYPKSPRYLFPAQIRELVKGLPSEIETVGVFVNEKEDSLRQIMAESGLKRAQLHGEESPDYVRSLEFPTMKAFRVGEGFQPEAVIPPYAPDFFLLDSYHPQFYGGTGDPFNWALAQRATNFGRLFLAGGLTPQNVAQAVRSVRPFGVDVCSGVESAPGIKDLALVKSFIEAVRTAESFLD